MFSYWTQADRQTPYLGHNFFKSETRNQASEVSRPPEDLRILIISFIIKPDCPILALKSNPSLWGHVWVLEAADVITKCAAVYQASRYQIILEPGNFCKGPRGKELNSPHLLYTAVQYRRFDLSNMVVAQVPETVNGASILITL